jgi:hypothetical protein
MATQDDFIRTALRVPPTLHKRLHEAATSNNRTFNAEIVDRLQKSFTQEAEPAGLLSSEFGLPSVENVKNNPDLYKHIAVSAVRPLKDSFPGNAHLSMADIRKIHEETFISQLKSVLDEYKEIERRERARLLELALGAAEPFSKTKKP